jgi:radical SAM superfamily enzyme YgiQ (UPF0313 family)
VRVLFVGIGSEQLNISLLASVLRRHGHQVGLAFSRHLFDDRDMLCIPRLAKLFADDDVVEQALRFRPDVVCYSALTVTYQWMLEVARRVKDGCGALNIFGGVHPSAVPQVVLEEPAVDYVCVGEGEVALPMLLDEIRRGGPERPIPNFLFRGPKGELIRGPQMPFIQDLDRLPPFEKDLWVEHVRLDRAYYTMSSRGCPYRCTFCFNNFFANLGGSRTTAGQYVRQRSVDHFMAELVKAKRLYGIRFINILDDIFTLDTSWLKEFARRYRKEIGVPYQCLSHSHFLDEERVEALRESGCIMIQIGVQSIDEEYKKRELRRSDKSNRIDHALNLLGNAGIGVKTDHIFGLPGESLDSQYAALDFYAKHPALRRIATYWLTYLPGTEMMNQGLRAGALTQEQVDRINRGETTFWHRERNVQDAELRATYVDFEILFRLIPHLPASWRERFRPEHVHWLPDALKVPVGMAADVSLALFEGSVDMPVMFSRIFNGLRNHLRWRFGLPPRGRFAPGDTGPVDDPVWDSLFAETVAPYTIRASGCEEAIERDESRADWASTVAMPVSAEPLAIRVVQ